MAATLLLSQAAVSAPAKPRSLCANGETVIYSCGFGKKTASVCLGADTVSYHYGRPGAVELSVKSDAGWSNIHLGYVVGGGGGHQSSIRFSQGEHEYIAYEGIEGSLHADPGHRWSGLHVETKGTQISSRECKGAHIVASDWSIIAEHAPAGLGETLYEPEGSEFNLWF